MKQWRKDSKKGHTKLILNFSKRECVRGWCWNSNRTLPFVSRKYNSVNNSTSSHCQFIAILIVSFTFQKNGKIKILILSFTVGLKDGFCSDRFKVENWRMLFSILKRATFVWVLVHSRVFWVMFVMDLWYWRTLEKKESRENVVKTPNVQQKMFSLLSEP